MKKTATLLLLAALLLTACSDKSGSLSGAPTGGASATAPAADPLTPGPGSDAPAPTAPAPSVPTPTTPAPSVPTPTQPGSSPAQPVNFTVRDGDWETVQWESYSNVYFTLRIPKGWKVE